MLLIITNNIINNINFNFEYLFLYIVVKISIKKIVYYILTNCIYKPYIFCYLSKCNTTIFVVIIIVDDYRVINIWYYNDIGFYVKF